MTVIHTSAGRVSQGQGVAGGSLPGHSLLAGTGNQAPQLQVEERNQGEVIHLNSPKPQGLVRSVLD